MHSSTQELTAIKSEMVPEDFESIAAYAALSGIVLAGTAAVTESRARKAVVSVASVASFACSVAAGRKASRLHDTLGHPDDYLT